MFDPSGDVALWLGGQRRSPGRTAGGLNPTSSSGGPGWWIYEQAIFLHEVAQQQVWQALEGLTDSGALPMVVPAWWAIDQFIPYGAGVTAPNPIPFSDGTTFDDGTGFVGGAIAAEIAEDATLNATTVKIRLKGGNRALVGNEHFTIVHPIARERTYRVVQIKAVDGDVATVQIRPWLRQSVTAAEEVDFNYPRFLANCVTPDTFRMALDVNRHANVSIRFEEYFDEETGLG